MIKAIKAINFVFEFGAKSDAFDVSTTRLSLLTVVNCGGGWQKEMIVGKVKVW